MKTCAAIILVLLMCHDLSAAAVSSSVEATIVNVSTTLMAPTVKGVAKISGSKALVPDEWQQLEDFCYTEHPVRDSATLENAYRINPNPEAPDSSGVHHRVRPNILGVFVFDDYNAIIETIDNRIAEAKSARPTAK